MHKKIITSLFLFLLIISSPSAAYEYKEVTGIHGKIISIGSDTLNNLMTFWSEKFKDFYPNVIIQIEGKGSSTAPPALISSTAQFGPMSRKMKNSEIDKFEKKFGYKPTYIRVAIDSLAVFVHKDNNIPGLSLDELDAIFSKHQKRGHSKIINWSDLSSSKFESKISIYGRNSASGTYGFFKKIVLKKGDYKNIVKEQPGSASVVQSIAKDLYAIGYSGIGYKTSDVRALPLAFNGKNYIEPTRKNAETGQYPLARFLYIYISELPCVGTQCQTQGFSVMG